MRLQNQQKTRDVEVLVVISLPLDQDPMRFRVAVHGWQLQDMRRNESYAAAVFDAFAVGVCERLELDAAKCEVKFNLNELLRGAGDDAIYTGDVLSETLFLH